MKFRQTCFSGNYLWLPLFTSNLNLHDCAPNIEKIRKRLTGWKSELSSFVGRVEIINSTLSPLHMIWASSFIIPKRCIAEIDKHVRFFFWDCFEDKKKMKTVAWAAICRPIENDGLGIRSAESSAAVALLRLVWAIASKKKSFWTDWAWKKSVSGNYLWDLTASSNCSWAWGGILQRRSGAAQMIQHLIGHGRSTSFWFNLWLPCGRWVDRYGRRPVYDMGMGCDIRVSDFILNNQWSLPTAISICIIDIFELIQAWPQTIGKFPD